MVGKAKYSTFPLTVRSQKFTVSRFLKPLENPSQDLIDPVDDKIDTTLICVH